MSVIHDIIRLTTVIRMISLPLCELNYVDYLLHQTIAFCAAG